MVKKDPFLPPTKPVKSTVKKDDPFLPADPNTEAATPELVAAPGFDLEELIRGFLDIPRDIPRSESVVATYILTLRERLRMHGYNKLALKWAEHAQAISGIVSNMASAQKAKNDLQRYLIEQRLLPEILHAELGARISEAKKRKRLAEED